MWITTIGKRLKEFEEEDEVLLPLERGLKKKKLNHDTSIRERLQEVKEEDEAVGFILEKLITVPLVIGVGLNYKLLSIVQKVNGRSL